MPILPTSTLTESITKPKLILVEGRDELNFFNALLSKIQMFNEKKNLIEIVELGGVDNLNNKLNALKSRTGFELVKSIAIIRDSDGDKEAAFQSVQRILMNSGLSYPQNIFTYSDSQIRTGIFIMPGSINGNMLEDLCLETVNDHPLTIEIDKYISAITQIDALDIPKNMSKAKTLMFLASMPVIVNNLGLGAHKGYWDFEHSSLNTLINFINEL